MKIKYLNIILVLLSFCSYTAHSQINCTVPLSPVLTSVSVQPETGKTEFTWILSESTDIAGYIIYSFKGGDGKAIDTVWNPAATSYTITNTAPKYSSVSYVIAAHRLSLIPGVPGCTSPLSNVLSTIFCEADIDTCNKKINVLWNSYPSIPREVTGYSLMMSVNGGEFSEISAEEPGVESFALVDFITGAEYCFYVRANLEGGLYSTSNKACIITNMQRPPGWINADYATVNSENKIVVSFSIDPSSEISDFILERKSGETGAFMSLAHLKSASGSVIYTDVKADIKIQNYYRLWAINSCDIPIVVSNVSSNMVLSLETSGNEIDLSWNSYKAWIGNVSQYRLLINTGSGFLEKALIGANDTSISVSYKEIMYDVTGNEICFYINAVENSNPHGITGESNSSVICTSSIEKITVPNLFTPNNDLVNDLFKPVLSFTPEEYHLIISDQHGSLIFETKDSNESWDGTRNGKPLPDGICLWFLKVTTPSGKKISKTGTLTIIKNP